MFDAANITRSRALHCGRYYHEMERIENGRGVGMFGVVVNYCSCCTEWLLRIVMVLNIGMD